VLSRLALKKEHDQEEVAKSSEIEPPAGGRAAEPLGAARS